MFHFLENLIVSYAGKMPLEIFAPLASIIEEVVAPIPSPAIMIVTGSLASLQGKVLHDLIILSLLGSLGKTIGAIIVYYIADKIEDFFAGTLEKYFGVRHEDIEAFGQKLKGGAKDYFVMIFMRALPIIPSSLISIGSGVLKIPIRLFIVSTIVGSIFRDFLYIYFGYAGISILEGIIKKSESLESIIQMVVFVILFFGFAWAYYKRRKAFKK